MARWKARVDFLLTGIALFFYLLPLMRYKAKRVKTHCFLEGWVSLSPDFRGRDRPSGIFFGLYKTRHILLSNSANCTVLLLRAVVLTHYRRVTDRQTDGIAIASRAIAMRALRRALKSRD